MNALLGSWGRRGRFYNPEKASVPHFHLPDFSKPNKNWRDAMSGKYKLADLALASGVCDASIPSPEMSCAIKGCIVNGTNLINTLPNQKKTIATIQALDLLVVVDTIPMEITGYADVVLPECAYLERYDSLRISQGREPSIALRMSAVDPLYNSKPAFWIVRGLAKKLDLLQYFSLYILFAQSEKRNTTCLRSRLSY